MLRRKRESLRDYELHFALMLHTDGVRIARLQKFIRYAAGQVFKLHNVPWTFSLAEKDRSDSRSRRSSMRVHICIVEFISRVLIKNKNKHVYS